MAFLFARTPLALALTENLVASRILDAVPFVVLTLSMMLLVVAYSRRRLEGSLRSKAQGMSWYKAPQPVAVASAITSSEAEVESAPAVRKKQKQPRTHRQRKQARRNASSALPDVACDPPALAADVSSCEEIEAARATIVSSAEETDSQTDAELARQSVNRIVVEDVDVHHDAPEECPVALEKEQADSALADADGAATCPCKSRDSWGCPSHAVYSSSLLLAHRELSLRIAKGPPGLELPPDVAKEAKSRRTCFAMYC